MSAKSSPYFILREKIRRKAAVPELLYTAQNIWYSNFGTIQLPARRPSEDWAGKQGVALCCRIRDEARFLKEFVEYYLAAGVQQFFFYEKLSLDNFREVLAPYVEAGYVTLIADWPHVPVSPTAEEDCVRRCIGRYDWVGFIDADEFVVVKDGRSIGEFLGDYKKYPGVALHWRMYGSNGHELRPAGPVIAEYTSWEGKPNRHVKCFVRPELASKNRNSHSWYYRGMKWAVTENFQPIRGSFRTPATADKAWINHYHHKSNQDYFEKAARKSVLDTSGIKFPNRNDQRHAISERTTNEVYDDSAVRYYRHRCGVLQREPVLLQAEHGLAVGLGN